PAIMPETGDSGHTSGLDGSAKNSINPVDLGSLLRVPRRFEIRADKWAILESGYSAVSTVQSSRPTRTVCSDWATGLRVSSTRTGYPPTHLLWVKSNMARFAVSLGNLSSNQRGAKGRVENLVWMCSRTFLDSSFLTPLDLM